MEVWDPMSSTPGRQAMTWRNWRRNEERVAMLANIAAENDASSTAVEIDTENIDSHEARRSARQALETHRVSRGPDSYEAQQFTWTFRCPINGCGWADVSETTVAHCRRCREVGAVVQPKKYPTFLDTVCQHCFDNREEDWFYFCHICQKCTWTRRCCRTDCVDVQALKRGQQRRT